jgi:hypothetical protein
MMLKLSFGLFVPLVFLISACQPGSGTGKEPKAEEPFVLPTSIPQSVPVYPGARKFRFPGTGISNDIMKKAGGGATIFYAPADKHVVAAYYKTELAKIGYLQKDFEDKPDLLTASFSQNGLTPNTLALIAQKGMPTGSIVQIMYMPAIRMDKE